MTQQGAQGATPTMSVSPGNVSIGWIGTGVMGCHMAMHLLRAGYTPMTVYNRTTSKAQPLLDAGAKLAATPKEVATASQIVFVMVSMPADVREVIASPTGVLAGLPEGGIVIDLTTSDPSLAAELAALGAAQGKTVIDAPVTGGDVGAKNGTLSTLTGGHRGAIELVMPLLDRFSSTVTIFGGPGTGQHAKMANQITIASTMIGLCEGLMYAHASGLDLETYLGAISGGAAGSFALKSLAPRILTGNFEPGFFTEHFVKDLGIAIKECAQMKLSLPGLALAQQLYNSLMAHGEGRTGTQALMHAIERLNARNLPVKDKFAAW